MKYRNNRNGEPISILGYGCMRFTKKGNSIDIDKAEKGQYMPTQLDELIDKATANSVQVINTVGNEQGFYYCRVTNTYNGTTSIKCSNFFNVIDTKINA